MTPDIDFPNGYLSGASIDMLVAQVQIYSHGSCSVTSVRCIGGFIHPTHVQIYPYTFEYIRAMHIQIYPCDAHSDISVRCTFRYIRAMHIQIYPCNVRSDISVQCAFRYIRVMHIQIYPCNAHSDISVQGREEVKLINYRLLFTGKSFL